MHDEIVTFEVAKLAKERGFPQHIGNDAYIVENEYDDEYEVGCHYPIQFIPDYLPTIAAPTQSLLQRWLREEKKWNIVVRMYENEGYYWFIQNSKGKLQESYFTYADEMFATYELALENALKYALENLV